MIRRRALFVVLLAIAPLGCRLFRPVSPNGQPTPKTEPAEAAPVAAAAPEPSAAPAGDVMTTRGRVSDANIAAMIMALNNTDISYARLADTRAERADVKEFARRMLTDHAGLNALLNDALKQLDLAAEDNEASLDMRDESANNRDVMRELQGYAFDSTYVENEVRYHRKFLASLDDVMIPRARETQIKSLLTVIRPAVAGHLAHAEQVRANVLAKR